MPPASALQQQLVALRKENKIGDVLLLYWNTSR
jgi:hypothetical protein